MKIVISEFMDSAAVEQLQQHFEVVYDPGLVDQPDALRKALASADALIVRNRSRVDAALLAAAPALKVVGRRGGGHDNIDVPACAERSMKVITATGANSQAVSEKVVAVSMLLLRGGFMSSADVASGKWPRAQLSEGRETAGKVLGLVGFGSIGQLTAQLARGLGMAVIAYDPAVPDSAEIWSQTKVQPRSLDTLVADADVISLHVPLLESTRHLFNAALIARMKPGAMLVNTARGGIVDESALAAALIDGRLGGAALDVFDVEPVPAVNPFAAAPNLILTPHIAGVTAESNVRGSRLIADQVSACLLN
jgi:(S)-sulfolactate dehydrogenase